MCACRHAISSALIPVEWALWGLLTLGRWTCEGVWETHHSWMISFVQFWWNGGDLTTWGNVHNVCVCNIYFESICSFCFNLSLCGIVVQYQPWVTFWMINMYNQVLSELERPSVLAVKWRLPFCIYHLQKDMYLSLCLSSRSGLWSQPNHVSPITLAPSPHVQHPPSHNWKLKPGQRCFKIKEVDFSEAPKLRSTVNFPLTRCWRFFSLEKKKNV